jgi:sec-independent protein translocase protein TatB
MFGFAWSELILIGAVALVVIGPKDLPRVMRTAGQWSRKLRFLASDFQRHVDDMVRQAELDEVKREAEKAMDVGSIGGDFEKSIGVADFENAVKLDQAAAAATVPPPPAETPAFSAPLPLAPAMLEQSAGVRSGVELSDLPVESVPSMPPPLESPRVEPVTLEPAAGVRPAGDLTELPAESVSSLPPPAAGETKP